MRRPSGVFTLSLLAVPLAACAFTARWAGARGVRPFVPALAIEVGYYLRHGKFLTEFTLKTIGSEGLDRLWEWFLGSLLLGPA